MVKNRSSIKYKIICIVIGLTLSLIGLELFLCLLGFGYNLMYRLPKDTEADYRIFCAGESTTWGIGASNPILKGYPRQLEDILNEKFSTRKIQCFFDQTIGQNTSEILLKLPDYIKKYRPHLIIFMVGKNNWWNLDRSNILLFNKNKFISEFTLKVQISLDRFRIWKLFKWIAYSLDLKKERWNYYWRYGNPVEYEKMIRNRFNFSIFAKIAEYDLAEMIKIYKLNNVNVIICSYPLGGYEGLYYVHKTIHEKFGIPFVDNFKTFKELPNKEVYFSTSVPNHPNDKGYRVVAENIFKCIIENRLIE